MSIELINVIETYQIGDNDVYDFIVKIDNGKYKVRYIDYWVNGKSKGCSIENVYDEDGNEVEYKNWIDELDEMFFNNIM
jgi:hypothetical protein|tara:strand:- start:83 stop:319 length:237 start_codon:yes stop_codon:yes gene_type:complete